MFFRYVECLYNDETLKQILHGALRTTVELFTLKFKTLPGVAVINGAGSRGGGSLGMEV